MHLCSVSQMFVCTRENSISKARAGVMDVTTNVDVSIQRRGSTNVMMRMYITYITHDRIFVW